MSTQTQRNDLLETVLVEVGRSALQFMGECWPWSDVTDESELVQSLLNSQAEQVTRLVALLTARSQIIDYGTYPTEYTDLHYTSLEFLRAQLVTNQAIVVKTIEDAVAESNDDPDANALLSDMLEQEKECLEKLQGLAQ